MSDQDDIMPIEMPSDEDLFKAEDTQEPEAKAEEPDKVEAESKETKEQTENEEHKEPEPKEKEDSGDHRVPLTELLNEREKRQQMEAQLQAMQYQVEQQQLQQQAQAQGQEQWPDMFENPEHYQQWMQYLATQMPQNIEQNIQQQVNQQLAMARTEFLGEMSLRSARQSDPDTYDKAWAELERRTNSGDHSWRLQALQSSDPGQEVLKLYKQNSVVQDVGDDPEAYFQRRIEELKGDPAALAALLGGQAPSQSPRFDIPPSINKAGGGNLGGPGGISQNDMWSEINK